MARVFVPFGELQPDAGILRNSNLVVAENVVPLVDTYAPAGMFKVYTSSIATGEPFGFHVHPSANTSGGDWLGYLGTATKLYEVSQTSNSATWTVTDKTRSAGGDYAAARLNSAGSPGWQGTSFGTNVIMTDHADDVQLLTSPAAANFTKLAQSGSGNPGMDPKAKFLAPVRNNLFLANLTLAAAFDGLPIGANPYTVCWSQTDNIRQYGSSNVTPQLIGAGYQSLTYDLGEITGLVGGEYALIFMQRGVVRVDGPPYMFRLISSGVGCLYPNSIVRFDDDVYFWSPSGPAVFRGGEGPSVPLTVGKLQVTLDVARYPGGGLTIKPYAFLGNASGAAEHVNRQIWWSYDHDPQTVDPGFFTSQGDKILVLNIADGRWSFIRPGLEGGTGVGALTGAMFLRTLPRRPIVSTPAAGWGGTLEPWAAGLFIAGVVTSRQGKAANAASDYKVGRVYPTAAAIATVLTTGFMQLAPDRTTRIVRVRPICSGSPVSTTVKVTTRVNPAADASAAASFTTMDAHKWVPTPTTVFGDLHQIEVDWSAVPITVSEMEGVEIDYLLGPEYSA